MARVHTTRPEDHMSIQLESQTEKLRTLLEQQRTAGKTIGFVPTMGYLHAGHQALVSASHRDDHFTLVSVFVNPAQFGPNEDLYTYPRSPERDFRLAEEAGADLVWYPDGADLYPPGSQFRISPGALEQKLCGTSRPLFFGGICTVVLKLFQLIRPDAAYFGEKDFQQLTIIKRMVREFYLDLDVVGCPTIREADGLAMSSRNVRLPTESRHLALTLYRTIGKARAAFAAGERDAQALRNRLLAEWPEGLKFDYLDFRDPEWLGEVTQLAPATRLFLGCWLDGVRLIDNGALTP